VEGRALVTLGDVRSAMPLAEGNAYRIFEYGGPVGTDTRTA
jgi:hypothetical protein